ncbi:MAG: tRNA threonylcarbamoyladenosine dehydratase [Bacteroidales bacterium]
MQQWSERTLLLLGEQGVGRLAAAKVLVVGVGGVGAYAAEMLVRAGVGALDIVDGDTVSVTNLNRQLIALNSTIGKDKIDVMKSRLLDINPNLKIDARSLFLTPEQVAPLIDNGEYDFVVDAIDTIAPKVELISYCIKNKIKIVSSMGAGGRIDPTKIQLVDISATYHDGLAKVVRGKLKERGIRKGLPVAWSAEQANKSALMLLNERNKVSSYGTISYIPTIFGCMLASHVIRKLIG